MKLQFEDHGWFRIVHDEGEIRKRGDNFVDVEFGVVKFSR